MMSPNPKANPLMTETSSPAVDVGTGRALRSLSSSILKAMGCKPTPAPARNATFTQEP